MATSERNRRIRIRRWLKYSFGIIALLLVLLVWYVFYPPVGSDVVCLQPVAWTSADGQFLCRVDATTGNLLLRFGRNIHLPTEPDTRGAYGPPIVDVENIGGEVYEYLRQKKQIRRVPEAAWENASTRVCSRFAYECRGPGAPNEVRVRDRALWNGHREIPTAGRNAISISSSPGGDLIAVVSAAGFKRPFIRSPVPFGGGWGGSYAAQHYVELFTLAKLQRKGDPIRIPLTTAEGMGLEMWSANGEYIVYTEPFPERVCIVPTVSGSTTRVLRRRR